MDAMNIQSLSFHRIRRVVLFAVLLSVPMLMTSWAPAVLAETPPGPGTQAGMTANQAPGNNAAIAPQPLLLDLETAVKLALENNTDLKRSGLDVVSARLGLDSKERMFHPSLSLSGSVSSAGAIRRCPAATR